ncbi:hypothetical protein ABH897_005546 [Paenibacillus sp. RC73]
MNKLTNDEIRQNVRNHYQQIAVKEVNPPPQQAAAVELRQMRIASHHKWVIRLRS